MIETGFIAAAIALGLHTIRRNWPTLASAWADARWYERAGLLLFLIPIPGPVDEIVGLLVLRRIVRRSKVVAS